jgi:hypothetical protein
VIILESVDPEHHHRCARTAKTMLWIYFWLIFAEGILRKWLFPQFSAPLAVVRDPFLILAIVFAMRANIFPWNGFTASLSIIGVASLSVGLLADNNTLFVALNGFRTDFIHFYLVFLLPALFSREDVNRVARYSVWMLPPIAALMVYQFYSPPNDWINKTTELSTTSHQLAGTYGNIRPPSIFTFISGVAEYVTMTAAFLLAGIIERVSMGSIAKFLGTISIIVAVSVSISRYALAGVSLVILCYIIFALLRPNMGSQLIGFLIVGFFSVFVLLQFGFLEKSLDAFTTRVQLASSNEGGAGGFFARITSNFTDPILAWPDADWLGMGIGTLTNAGALLIQGNLSHLQVENELSRLLLEGGLVMGPAFIIWRAVLGVYLIVQAFRVAYINGDPLAWLLIPIVAQLVIIGQLGRPTTLGFMAFSSGLCLTIIRHSDTHTGSEA